MLSRLQALFQGRALWRTAAAVGTLAVLVACWMPAKRLPQTELLNADKLLHLLAFLALGFCWHRAGLNVRRTLLICLALAIGTEIGQAAFAGGRSGDLYDAVADMLGALLGVFLSSRLGRSRATAPHP